MATREAASGVPPDDGGVRACVEVLEERRAEEGLVCRGSSVGGADWSRVVPASSP